MDFGFSPRKSHAPYFICLLIGIAIGFGGAKLFYNRSLDRSIDTATEIERGSESLGDRLGELEQYYNSIGVTIDRARDGVGSVKDAGVSVDRANRDVVDSHRRIGDLSDGIRVEVPRLSEIGERSLSRIGEINRIIDDLEIGLGECTCVGSGEAPLVD